MQGTNVAYAANFWKKLLLLILLLLLLLLLLLGQQIKGGEPD